MALRKSAMLAFTLLYLLPNSSNSKSDLSKHGRNVPDSFSTESIRNNLPNIDCPNSNVK